MRHALAIAFACALLIGIASPGLSVSTLRDGAGSLEAPDTRAGMCDGFDGLAFTFCVAVCEARACDLLDGDDARCALLRDGLAAVTGGVAPPCEDAAAPAHPL